METPYEIWLQSAQWFLRIRCLKGVDNGQPDNGWQRPTYPISSSMSLWLRWAKNVPDTVQKPVYFHILLCIYRHKNHFYQTAGLKMIICQSFFSWVLCLFKFELSQSSRWDENRRSLRITILPSPSRTLSLQMWCECGFELIQQQETKWAVSWQNQQNYCAPSEDSDQPRSLPRLIRVFAVRPMGS